MNRIPKMAPKKLITAALLLPLIGWIGLYAFVRLLDMGFPFHMRPSFYQVLAFPDEIKGKSKAQVIDVIGKPDRDEGLAWIYRDHEFFNMTGMGSLTVFFDRNTGTVHSVRYDSSGN